MRIMLLRLLPLLTTVCAIAVGARAAELSGHVLLPHRGVAREAVVYLEGGRKAGPLAHVVVDQRDKTFLPHVTVITQGTTVSFPNNDTVLHNVFAYYNAKKFDLGVYPRGASKRVTFDNPGVVALLCNVHSDMSAYICVVNTPYYTITDDQGRFRLHDIPPGSYTLHAWHESGSAAVQTVTVAADNPPMTLGLSRK